MSLNRQNHCMINTASKCFLTMKSIITQLPRHVDEVTIGLNREATRQNAYPVHAMKCLGFLLSPLSRIMSLLYLVHRVGGAPLQCFYLHRCRLYAESVV